MYTVVTPAASTAVSVAEAKTHCRVDGSTEDTFIGTLLAAAEDECETYTHRKLISQTIDYVIDGFPCGDSIELPFGLVSSITSLTYTDSDGSSDTFTEFFLAQTSGHGLLHLNYGSQWPSVTLRPKNAITIRLVCGYANAAAVPAPLKHGIKLLVGALYNNRENFVAEQGVTVVEIPATSRILWSPYKIWL